MRSRKKTRIVRRPGVERAEELRGAENPGFASPACLMHEFELAGQEPASHTDRAPPAHTSAFPSKRKKDP